MGADTAVAPAAAGRSFHGRLLVPLLVAVQTAWLVLLAYGAIRILH